MCDCSLEKASTVVNPEPLHCLFCGGFNVINGLASHYIEARTGP